MGTCDYEEKVDYRERRVGNIEETRWIHPRRKDVEAAIEGLRRSYAEKEGRGWPGGSIQNYLVQLAVVLVQTVNQLLDDVEEIYNHDLRRSSGKIN